MTGSAPLTPLRPRTPFTGSTLIRLLTDLARPPAAEARQTVAERLSLWLDWTDAIALSAALNGAGAAMAPAADAGASRAGDALFDEFTRVRAGLAESITTDGALAAPVPQPDEGTDDVAEFSPYRRRYLAHQQAMVDRIGPLRARVRRVLSDRSPALGRLAALDAVFDEALAARERHLLSHVPALLEERFERLRDVQPRRWGSVFGRDLRQVLLAELDLRLQPVEGMLEALDHGNAGRP